MPVATSMTVSGVHGVNGTKLPAVGLPSQPFKLADKPRDAGLAFGIADIHRHQDS